MKTIANNSASIVLAAGPLSMVFEPTNAMLRYVRLGDVELVRGIFGAVRNHDWDTIPFCVQNLKVNQSAHDFSISFEVECLLNEAHFCWQGTIVGTSAGLVRFNFHGIAQSTFLKNRIGLCVLHPVKECAGQRAIVEHVDGSITDSFFPTWIAPHQPFKNILAITQDVAATELQARVAMDGDVFEMEDQRNWTDASFKTYCTPLDLPFPVEITAGSEVNQSVTIELLGSISTCQLSQAVSVSDASAEFQIAWEEPQLLPPIGLSMSTCGEPVSTAAIQRLSELNIAHLRADLHLARDDWRVKLSEASELANRIGARLELALFTHEVGDEQWQSCVTQLRLVVKQIARCLVFDVISKATPNELAIKANQSLQKLSPSMQVVVGTNAYFAELNRNRPKVPKGCSVCFSINPQVHAFDNLSIRETLQAHRWTIDSAYQYFGRSVVVSPITLRPRSNPNATSTKTGNDVSQPESDVRQSTGMAAAWTVGALAQLALHSKLASLTFFETYGPRGIMNAAGQDYAMTSVFKNIGDCVASFPSRSNSVHEVAAFALQRRNGQRVILLGNLSPRKLTLKINGIDGQELQYAMDAESVRFVSLEEMS